MKINMNLGRALALDEVLPKVLESLFEIFPQADRGFVVMKDASGNLFPRWVKTRRMRDETQSVRISRTIIREAMSSGTAILSLDASNDQRFRLQPIDCGLQHQEHDLRSLDRFRW